MVKFFNSLTKKILGNTYFLFEYKIIIMSFFSIELYENLYKNSNNVQVERVQVLYVILVQVRIFIQDFNGFLN